MRDQDLLQELQFSLMEPPDGGQSWPSEIWRRDEVLQAISQDELLKETFLLVTRVEQAVLAGATSVALPTTWLATLQLVWRTQAGARRVLNPVDMYEADMGLASWQATPATPIAYADLDATTLTLRLVPTPVADGTLELLYVAAPAPLLGNGASLTVPDEFVDGVKYAALAELLSKVGRLQDPERAAYCQQRVELTKLAADIILQGWA